MKLTHDGRIHLLALGAALPAAAVALGILWTGDYSSKVRWTRRTGFRTLMEPCMI